MNNNTINILSGGLGTDLFINGDYDRSKVNSDPLWSARVVYENPKAIKDVHLRFLKAGSNVISTATYQASVEGYMAHVDVSKEKAEQIIGSTVDIAREAVSEFDGKGKVIISGSVAPYGATLHDRSEYSGEYIESVDPKVIRDYHKSILELLLSKGVDIIAHETVPTYKEALIFAELLRGYPNAKAYVSFTTKDGEHTSFGESFSEAFKALSPYKQIIAVGINCSEPSLVLPVAKIAKQHMGEHQRFIAYPNGPSEEEYKKLSSKPCTWLDLIPSWLETGVFGWIGGCCLVTPMHITKIKETVRKWEAENSV